MPHMVLVISASLCCFADVLVLGDVGLFFVVNFDYSALDCRRWVVPSSIILITSLGIELILIDIVEKYELILIHIFVRCLLSLMCMYFRCYDLMLMYFRCYDLMLFLFLFLFFLYYELILTHDLILNIDFIPFKVYNVDLNV